MVEQIVYSAARSVPLKFRTSAERKAQLRKLADDAGVSMQVYVEAKVFGLSFEEVKAPGPRREQRDRLPGLDEVKVEPGKDPLRPTG